MEKLDCKSLMIGDWVMLKLMQYPTVVTDIFDGCIYTKAVYPLRYDDIEPIPLTKEILEKNGFEEFDGWYIYIPENTGIEIAWLGTILKIGGECGNLELPTIEYVHQLQHALRLCGLEKEIEL